MHTSVFRSRVDLVYRVIHHINTRQLHKIIHNQTRRHAYFITHPRKIVRCSKDRRHCVRGPGVRPVNLINVDVTDGFYRVWVGLHDVPKLGVAFPSLDGEEQLVTFLLALWMGWVSPVGRFDIFVDDHIGVAQGDPTHLRRLRRALL